MKIIVRSHGRAQRESEPTGDLQRRGNVSAGRVGQRPSTPCARSNPSTCCRDESHCLDIDNERNVWLDTVRALLRIRSADDAASLLHIAVRRMGATVVSARDTHGGAIYADLALGAGTPLFAVAGSADVRNPRLDEILPALAEDAQRAVDLIRRKAQLEEESTRDPLTGLANRRVLDRLIARANEGVIIAIDLDGFKLINDTLGHAVGDSVLSSFGRLLLEQVRAHDIACRYGGDEFVIIARSATSEALAMVARIRERWSIGTTDVTFSAGVAPITSRGGIEAMLDADAALYLAKRNGRNRTEVAVPGAAASS